MQLRVDESVGLINMLDAASPYRLTDLPPGFPQPDDALLESAPLPSDPDYGTRALEFIRSTVPDSWDSTDVRLLSAYMGSVTASDAYPSGGSDLHLLPLLNLEIWGLPTSMPARDPANSNFVYQRFQRGILHYDASTGWTQGVLLGDEFKKILMQRGLLARE
jgi:hypothetical protein